MTNDEAINTLKNTAFLGWSEQAEKVSEAVQMAVEALKRETSGDAISRQAAIRIASGYCHPANVAKELAKLPSVQPDIIYCKDCKDYHKIPTGEVWTCRYFKRAVMGNDFCSYAERRTDEPERKTGKWILADTYDGRKRYRCSECLSFALKTDDGQENLSNYCPVCGAEMKGEDDGTD